jgi:hypothetical protein
VASVLTQTQAQLSLQQHLDISSEILDCVEDLEGELQPLRMAQAGGPTHSPPNDKRRVKVYELRDGDWFDRGTGFCKAEYLVVSFTSAG